MGCLGPISFSDRDESSHLDEKEIQQLVCRLDMLEGIKVNQAIFQQKASKDPSMHGIMAILHASLNDNPAPEDQVFAFFDEIPKL